MKALGMVTLLALAIGAAGPAAAHRAHEHGVASLDVAIDGNTVSIAIDAPLDGFVGFERAPRTEAERRRAAQVLAQLRQPETLFAADAAAGCAPVAAETQVRAPVLEPAAAPGKAGAASAAGTAGTAGGDHADLEAAYVFRCTQPDALRALELRLFEVFARLQRIDVQIASGQGQAKQTLRRPQRSLSLPR